MSGKTSSAAIDLGALSAGLSATCDGYLRKHGRTLQERIDRGHEGLEVARGYADMFDGLLGSLVAAADAAIRQSAGNPGRVALVAVGGYGRQLVAPKSDVDVLFLTDTPEDPRVAQLSQAVLYPLWDVGVDIGHAVRGLEDTLDLSRSDIRTSTTLLDMRRVAGDRSLVEELETRGRKEILLADLDKFLDSLAEDTASRHQRYGGSLYLREPEIKYGRGGLRDLDVVIWSARARWGVDSLAELVQAGALTEHEAVDLAEAQAHLWSVRNLLHSRNGRRHDRLTYEDQEGVAAALGYADGDALAVELFMQDHYRSGRIIARLVDCMGDRTRRSGQRRPDTVRDLGGSIVVHDGRVTFAVDEVRQRPVLALRLFRAALRERLPPDPEARDLISAAAEDSAWCEALRSDPEAAALFLDLLTRSEPAPTRAGSILTELHELGLLSALMPEMEAVTGRVRFDAYHVYTVDAHSVAAVDHLRALCRGELAREHFVVSRCAAEMPRPVPLHLAILLQGVGLSAAGDPLEHGAEIARDVATRLGLDEADAEHVGWLVRHQEALYHWALRRDITDPETIEEAAETVQSVYRLRDLFLFTFARVSTVNPTAMSDWTSRMLQDLWHAVLDKLEGRRGASHHLDRVRRELTLGVADEGDRAALQQFAAEMPERYLLANTTTGIRFHYRSIMGRGESSVVAACESGVGEGTYELLVSTVDRPGLLLDVAAALETSRFGVDSAQLYTRRPAQGPAMAFDLFHVKYPDGGEGVDLEAEMERVALVVREVLEGNVTARELVERRSKRPDWERKGPKVRTEVHVDNGASSAYTIVDVYTRDQRGVLHAIAEAVHEQGLSIRLAKVNTEGNCVADVFYVQTPTGEKLSGDGRLAALSRALQRALRRIDAS